MTQTSKTVPPVAGLKDLEAQAIALARQNRGQVNEPVYVAGSTAPASKERIFAAMLEAQPEAYAAFRAQHNAKVLVAQLEAAGVRLTR